MDILEKEKLIKKQIKLFTKLYENIDEDKKIFVYNLIKELCFMKVTLSELQDDINKNGAFDLFQQGLQKFQRESPAMKSYNSLIKNYNQTNKELMALLPESNKASDFDELMKALDGSDSE